ncbi:MAG: LacI family DNA-binding transcriptional regulator [Anaerolineaceae bacterium]|nr:LacI family DNA-binding transcriptional regulator [Anaerolineaceae bacterium]
MSATIKDVARAAGCSIKTVSRVVNHEPSVSDGLRARVQAAIRNVGYSPNLSARRLVQQKSYVICLLMYPGFSQPDPALLRRIIEIADEEKYEILIQPYFPGNPRSRNRLVELVTGRRADGMVSTPPCDSDDFLTALLSTYQVPLIQISPVEPHEDDLFIATDDTHGAYALTEYLISLGHRQIAFLMGPRNLRASADRLAGWQAAMHAHGLKANPGWMQPTEFTFDGGYTAVRLIWQQVKQPTAIFAGNDEAAYGAFYALQELGVRVPEDVSLAGYDDLAFSKAIWPGLTTVHQPAEEMVGMAVRMLINRLQGEAVPTTPVTFPSNLVIRGSTRSPRQA